MNSFSGLRPIITKVALKKQPPFFFKSFSTTAACLRASDKTFDNELQVSPDFINRNPCNLEHMLIANKPAGYELESPSNNYWYKLEYSTNGRYINSHVVHHSGRIVVTASTNETAIRKQLYSMKDFSAAKNLGRILAERCLQAGITFVSHEPEKGDEKRLGKAAFIESVEEGGVKLSELQPYRVPGVNEAY